MLGCVFHTLLAWLQGMDADNSGSITVDELKAGMKKAGSPVALAELQALLSHIDVDASGVYTLLCIFHGLV